MLGMDGQCWSRVLAGCYPINPTLGLWHLISSDEVCFSDLDFLWRVIKGRGGSGGTLKGRMSPFHFGLSSWGFASHAWGQGTVTRWCSASGMCGCAEGLSQNTSPRESPVSSPHGTGVSSPLLHVLGYPVPMISGSLVPCPHALGSLVPITMALCTC